MRLASPHASVIASNCSRLTLMFAHDGAPGDSYVAQRSACYVTYLVREASETVKSALLFRIS
jgi:hypothetical protein